MKLLIRIANLPNFVLADKFGFMKNYSKSGDFAQLVKNIHTVLANQTFMRRGSNSVPVDAISEPSYLNTEVVISIENNSRNSIAYTLDGVMEFMNIKHKDIAPKYKVFKELFVICWAGNLKRIRHQNYFTRVDIELINEQVKLFYSSFDVVTIEYNEDSFTIVEFVPLGLNDQTNLYPLEKVTIQFFENGYYKMENEFLFEPPQYNRKMLHHIYNANKSLLTKMQKGVVLNSREIDDLNNLSSTLMICYLNGFEDARNLLIDSKNVLKNYSQTSVYSNFKEVMRILRKMKYDSRE
jgi:hypothetical protein